MGVPDNTLSNAHGTTTKKSCSAHTFGDVLNLKLGTLSLDSKYQLFSSIPRIVSSVLELINRTSGNISAFLMKT